MRQPHGGVPARRFWRAPPAPRSAPLPACVCPSVRGAARSGADASPVNVRIGARLARRPPDTGLPHAGQVVHQRYEYRRSCQRREIVRPPQEGAGGSHLGSFQQSRSLPTCCGNSAEYGGLVRCSSECRACRRVDGTIGVSGRPDPIYIVHEDVLHFGHAHADHVPRPTS